MSEVVEDIADVDLYHYDFTTASTWEVFIARIEEIIYQWKLTNFTPKPPLKKGEYAKLNWKVTPENVSFADAKFVISLYDCDSPEDDVSPTNEQFTSDEGYNRVQALEDVMVREHDFVPLVHNGEETYPHILTKWYGLRTFIVLSSLSGGNHNESKLKTLLSSFCIAADNSKCEVPMFLRALEPWQKFYLGVCCGQGVRAEFEMIHLKRIPLQCKHLTGLSNMFKSKISSSGGKVDEITASVRLSYLLKNWTSYQWSQELPELELSNQDHLLSLPVGTQFEPLSGMRVNAVWPEVLESTVIDNEGYTDFEMEQAPVWRVSLVRGEQPAAGLLSDHLQEFIILCGCTGTVEELLGDLLAKESNFGESLNVLTESRIPKLSDLLFSDSSKKLGDTPIPQNVLLPILNFLFPDMDKNQQSKYVEKSEEGSTLKFKTCAEGSLLWRLSVCLLYVLHNLGGVRAATHLWHELLQELRFRWNSSTLIPGVSAGPPDPKTCLLHQKLQMVNCCIIRKKELQQTLLQPSDSESEEEEFFDCGEEGVEEQGGRTPPKHSLWNTPTGRLHRHPTLRLLANGQPLYVPKTQGSVPKTEDQLEEDTEALVRLGSSAEGSLLRAKLMSASLLSDMESFKAANPGAEIEDFIRWYSPRDWIEKDELDEFGQKTGELSSRMQLVAGNTWLEVWAAAKPVPARRQKRLFDETKEAERALHLLESAVPSEVGPLLVAVVTEVIVARLARAVEPLGVPAVSAALARLARRAEARSRQPLRDPTLYQDMVTEVYMVERLVAEAWSLEKKFEAKCCQEPMLASLVSEVEVEVPQGPRGPFAQRIRAMFSEQLKAERMVEGDETSTTVEEGATEEEVPSSRLLTPSHTTKEVVLRTRQPNGLPHRLTASVSRSEIIIATVFSSDTVFY